MTRPVPGGTRCTTEQAEPAAPVTLVLSREVKAGHEDAFEEVLHRLADEVGSQPGQLGVTVLRPPHGGGLAGRPGRAPVVVPPVGWNTALVSAIGIVIVIPLTQYAVMPLLTRAARPILYRARPGHSLKGAS